MPKSRASRRLIVLCVARRSSRSPAAPFVYLTAGAVFPSPHDQGPYTIQPSACCLRCRPTTTVHPDPSETRTSGTCERRPRRNESPGRPGLTTLPWLLDIFSLSSPRMMPWLRTCSIGSSCGNRPDVAQRLVKKRRYRSGASSRARCRPCSNPPAASIPPPPGPTAFVVCGLRYAGDTTRAHECVIDRFHARGFVGTPGTRLATLCSLSGLSPVGFHSRSSGSSTGS